MEQGPSCNSRDPRGGYTLITDEEDPRLAMFDKPLPFFGCGIGWLFFLLGFPLPFMWYYATILYCCKYYNRDPRERGGLAASAVMAMLFTIVSFITMVVVLLIIREYVPRLIKHFENVKVEKIAAGLLHSACIDEKDSLFVFGEPGFRESVNASKPSMIYELPLSEEVACGGYHTCAQHLGITRIRIEEQRQGLHALILLRRRLHEQRHGGTAAAASSSSNGSRPATTFFLLGISDQRRGAAAASSDQEEQRSTATGD